MTPSPGPGRPAVFLDRDGTVIVDRHHLSDPDGVELLPGAAGAIARLNRAGLPVVLVTNQSGIGRGVFGEGDFQAVQMRLVRELAKEGARVDAVYHCPHSPEDAIPCDCRKPKSGLFRAAAADLGLELSASFFVGDRLRDLAVVGERGGVGFLVPGADSGNPGGVPAGITEVASLAEAVRHILPGPPD